jgi:hypothetical protein
MPPNGALRGIAIGRKAWLADVLRRIADKLLPWNWKTARMQAFAA